MLYNVSFMLNGVDCANLVDADADMETVGKRIFYS